MDAGWFTNRKSLLVLLPAALALFLLGYCYLGAMRGSSFFRFLLYTVLGNFILFLAIAFYAYYITKNVAFTIPQGGLELGPFLLEDLYLVLFLVSLLPVFYSVFLSLLRVSGGYATVASLVPSFIASLFALLLFLEKGGKLTLIISYLVIGLIIAVTLSLADEVDKTFAELIKLISHMEALIKELGVT